MFDAYLPCWEGVLARADAAYGWWLRNQWLNMCGAKSSLHWRSVLVVRFRALASINWEYGAILRKTYSLDRVWRDNSIQTSRPTYSKRKLGTTVSGPSIRWWYFASKYNQQAVTANDSLEKTPDFVVEVPCAHRLNFPTIETSVQAGPGPWKNSEDR